MSLKSNSQVIKLWEKILGKEYVITDGTQREEAQTATFRTTQKILGILKPHTKDEIQQILTIAREYKVSLYTISTGKNWGYGSRIPIQDNSYLLDLSRMNKIMDYNEELGYVTVEPGVTQKQLYKFLKKKKAPFSLSITGSTPDSSIIGNICERGVGIGSYGFRSRYISALEIMLPSGKLIHTGYGRFSYAQAAYVYPEGVGPSFVDMFIQSNFGIITQLSLLLAPTPLYTQFIDLYISEEKQLPKFLKILHKFNFSTNSKKAISLYNDFQALSAKTQYPWKRTKGKTPLPAEIVTQLKKKYNISYSWRGVVEIYGFTRQEVDAQVSYFTSLTKKMVGIEISPRYRSKDIEDRPYTIGKSTYWRMKTKPPKIKNPDINGCGKIRLSIAVPFTVKNIREVLETIKKIIVHWSYEPFIEIHCISERSVLIVTTLLFDRTAEGEDTKALQCHDTLLHELMKKGYFPYRFNIHAMSLFPKSIDDYDDFQRTIKKALDPYNIFSPGRYEVKDN